MKSLRHKNKELQILGVFSESNDFLIEEFMYSNLVVSDSDSWLTIYSNLNTKIENRSYNIREIQTKTRHYNKNTSSSYILQLLHLTNKNTPLQQMLRERELAWNL